MKAHAKECLEHLRRRNDLLFIPSVLFADMFQANNFPAVNDWFEGKKFPIGEDKIRIFCFLQLLDYEVEELRDVNPEVIKLAQAVSFRLVETSEVKKRLGYQEDGLIIKILSGVAQASRQKHQAVKAINAETAEPLTKKKDEFLSEATKPKKKAVLHGAAKECLHHLVANDENAIEKLATNLSVSTKSINSWLREESGQWPRGKTFVGLVAILQAAGYETDEFVGLPAILKKLFLLLGLSVVDWKTMQEELGYNSEKDILRILSFDSGITPEKRGKIVEVENAMGDFLAEAAEKTGLAKTVPQEVKPPPSETKKDLREPEEKRPSPVVSPSIEPKKLGRENSDISKETLMQVLAHQMEAMLPLAELLNSDYLTPKDRESFRKQLQRHTPMRLSVALRGLCGERAREHEK